MSPTPLPRPISLRDVAEHRVWCPVSGGRGDAEDNAFAPACCCIGPRCAAWIWQSGDDADATRRQVCHLVPPHFSPSHRVRLASRLLPSLLEAFQTLAAGDGDLKAARAALLSWARTNWQPEQALPEPASWQRQTEPYWDDDADTVGLDLVRSEADDQRRGVCGLTGGMGAGFRRGIGVGDRELCPRTPPGL